MLKPYSKKRLRFINVLFKLSFTKSEIKNQSIKYLKGISTDILKFEQKLLANNQMKVEEVIRLTKLFSIAVYFRRNKKLNKEIVGAIFITPFIILLLLIPCILPKLFTTQSFSFWSFVLIYLIAYFLFFLECYFLGRMIDFVSNFEIRIGKTLTRFFHVFLVGSIFSLIYVSFFINIPFVKWGLLSSVFIICLLIVFAIFEYMLTVAVDVFFYSKKIQITDALIIESSFQLSKINWDDSVKKRFKRQGAIDELERLAGLIENDWSNHIKTKDEKTNKWKNNTLIGIAEGLRSLKKEIIIPKNDSSIILQTKFDSIFQKILVHDIFSLVGAEVPAVRIRKKAKYKTVKSLLVAIAPLCIVLSLKAYPVKEIPDNYVNLGVIVAGLWLLISIMLWLDPNLADKIATIKSARNLWKSNED